MSLKKPQPLNVSSRHFARGNPVIAGTYCGLISAVAYTAANICLRSVTHCDPVWVSCLKSIPTVILIGPWLIVLAARKQVLIPSMRVFVGLVLAALMGQLVGNVFFQWSLGIVGIAMAVPMNIGSMIVSGALLGRWLLGEVVTLRMAASVVVLISSICVLGLGAPAASQSVAIGTKADVSIVLLAAAIVGACLSGFAYCLLGVSIRKCADQGTPLATILTTVGSVGMIALATLSYLRIGSIGMWDTAPRDLTMMLLAGVCNAVAFLALTKALQLTGLLYVNALNASQSAMATMVGIIVFNEAPTVALVIGVLLTIAGLLLMKGRGGRAASAETLADKRTRLSGNRLPVS